MPLNASLSHHATHQPDKVAVSLGGREVSYGDLYHRSQRLNAYLAALPRQERRYAALKDVPLIALQLGNHTAMPELLAAALAGSCCVMLLDPLLPKSQLQRLLERLPPDALFTAQEGSDFDILAPIFALSSYRDLDPLIAKGAVTAPTSQPTDPFMVAFTSGTTATPKAFARDRGSWQRSLARGRRHFGLYPDLSTLAPGPLVHGLSLYAFAETLDCGATFYAMPKFTAKGAARLMSDHRVKRLVCVPTMLEALRDETPRLPELVQITTSGAKLDPELVTKVQGFSETLKITEYYGASELGFVSSITHDVNSPAGQSVGQAFPEIEIAIRRPNADGAGEIWVRSDLVIDDYLWRDDASGFQRDGDWSTVGDIGKMGGSDLFITGRAGGMVTSGGNNIYLEEVASLLNAHPALQRAVVLGVPDSYLGTKLIAIVEPTEDALSSKALVSYCNQHLQKYKTPREFFSLTDWPMTSSGKTAIGQLRVWQQKKDSRLAPL